MDTLDLRKQYAFLYKPSAKAPQLVNVPDLAFLAVDGEGDPNQEPFQEAVAALYSAAYTLKFAIKKAQAVDYPVMALEARWWVADGAPFSFTERTGWRWTAMILQPDLITPADVADAIAQAGRKKPNAALARLRLERFTEGRAAQIMHLGPYADEPATLDRMHNWVTEQGLQLRGKHHEIYLSDPARTAPEKMKTILRHPVEPAI
jgi:hypothetical protein